MSLPPETGNVVERAYIDMKVGGGNVYVRMLPEFREILMSLEGALSARLLRSISKPESFVCCMEWVSKAAKDIFIADPRLGPWATEFFKHVEHEVIEYYHEAG